VGAATPAAGYFRGGLPFNRLGHGPRPLVVVQGLLFENKPQPRFALGPYSFLSKQYTVFVVLRRPEMPHGCSMADMAADVAATIRREFGEPVDVIGVSTGGSIVQHLAADHPGVVRRLVIHSSACALSLAARDLQLRVAELAVEGRWTAASELLVGAVVPRHGIPPRARSLIVWPVSRLMAWTGSPADPTDLIVTILAEDAHDFRSRLHEIAAPTLVVAGADDPFYTEALFRETAEGIPGARLILYPGMGHPAHGRQFARDVLAFLGQTTDTTTTPRHSLSRETIDVRHRSSSQSTVRPPRER
jgi:pimeloyl-ACP methyl ester carboxylesterase